MAKKPMAWWVVPGIVTATLAGLGALGTFIVKSADYIKLPDVLAGEIKRNDNQDARLDKLITLQEYEASNRPAPRQQTFTEDDDKGRWVCVADQYEDCWERNLWTRAE